MTRKELPDNEKEAVLECLTYIHGDLKTAVDWCSLRAAMRLGEEDQEESLVYWRGLETYGQYVLGRESTGGWSLCLDCGSPLHQARRKGESGAYNQNGQEHTPAACRVAQKEAVAMQAQIHRELREEHGVTV